MQPKASDKRENERLPTYRLICALCETTVAEDIELGKSIELAKEHEAQWHSKKSTCYVKPFEPQRTVRKDDPEGHDENPRLDST